MSTSAPVRWMSLQAAANLLGMTAAALRKALDRRTARAKDGGIEAELDGVRGRKLGRGWRICLGPAWCDPQLEVSGSLSHASTSSQNVRNGRERSRT
jgi:hypothetical protein